ncbi:MAG: flagellar basal body rod protein FlgB [Polyangiaceae bacterium]|nr:flagellar basal body rod protein FlgB [Polyangiaceae bacterium]
MTELFGAIAPLQQALDYHLERHNVLASNVAHVDTPGYRPTDLARVEDPNFQAAFSIALERTAPGHLRASGEQAQSSVGRPFEDLSAGVGADGNYVSLDREAAKVAANHLRYDVISAVVSAELRQLAYAASDARG